MRESSWQATRPSNAFVIDVPPYPDQVVYSLESIEGEDGIDEETAAGGMPFAITTVGGKGILRCLMPLDYERRSWYQLRILAKDQASDQGRINTATAGLLVRLIDEDDQGPEFITVPSVTRVAEDAQPGTSVLRVKAIDGDRGVNQRIIYSLDASNQYFAIDPKDGVVYLIQQLDREDPNVVNGALMLVITATEDSPLRPSVTTEVTILVLDVNDQAPAFRTSGSYVAEVDENSPANVPVTFLGSESLPEVYDYDQVSLFFGVFFFIVVVQFGLETCKNSLNECRISQFWNTCAHF